MCARSEKRNAVENNNESVLLFLIDIVQSVRFYNITLSTGNAPIPLDTSLSMVFLRDSMVVVLPRLTSCSATNLDGHVRIFSHNSHLCFRFLIVPPHTAVAQKSYERPLTVIIAE